jgi:hypothetical protein
MDGKIMGKIAQASKTFRDGVAKVAEEVMR